MTSAPPAFSSAVLLAAGRSTRMSASRPGAPRKPLLELAGRSALEWCLVAFDACPAVGEIVIVGPAGELDELRSLVTRSGRERKVSGFAEGGEERTDSVRAGAGAVALDPEVVLIHDAARPLVRPERIAACAAAAREHGGALLAAPVRDTIKKSGEGTEGRLAVETLDRTHLWAAHTPQAFRGEVLHELLERAGTDGFRPTDDAALYERYRGPCTLVEDDAENFKLTTWGDVALAEALLLRRMAEEEGA